MGIQGLLPLLKSIQVNTHLSEFKGQTYIEYVLHRVRMMRHYGVKPYLVFDGGPLPAKKGTESERSKKRAENLARANKLTEQGQHAQAREILTRCVDVTPEMAAQVIKALKVEAVPYIVAPYEADAQLAYLERSAELPFLYQRVFDPRSETVVHLNPLEDCIEWDETRNAYVGIHLDADIARGIADGSVNPITMEAMNDINPQYQPHSSSSKAPLAERNKPKLSAPTSNGQTLKKFFTVLPKSRQSFGVPSGSSSGLSSPKQRRKSTGTSSGHRTLLEQMDSEREQKRQRESQARHASPPLGGPTTSRFFARTTSAKRKRDETEAETAASVPTTPRQARRARPSLASADQDEDLDKENEVPLSACFPDLVQQEEGYQSPTGSSDIVEVSSPIERLSIVGLKQDQVGVEEMQVPSEDVSSPVVCFTPVLPARTIVHIPYNSPTKPDGLSQASAILVFSTPESCQASRVPLSVDLADVVQSFPGCDEADQSFQSAGGPFTPGREGDLWEDDKVDFEVDADDSHPGFLGNLIGRPEPVDTGLQDIMAGWRNRWSHLGATGGKETKEISTTPISVTDVFGIPEEALGSCLTDQKAFAPTSATKFKRRRPLGEQTTSSSKGARRSDDCIGLSRNNTTSRQVLHLDESFDEGLSSVTLSQRLEDFRYVPA
ncbi:Rad2 nuclease [Tulasnella sp. 408]|nr:Rad2 nuclease [Tulasnella sp. 408]